MRKAVIFMALGIPFYVWARKQNNPLQKVFSKKEFLAAGMLIIVALVAIYSLKNGIVQI